ncbi:cell division protein FtsA [Geobacillus stearothermophilus]|nr:cell division protein FtsA [Geobacillus stearothermophilus]
MSSNEIVVSLDVGTSSVKVIIGEMLGSSINIIGIGNVKSEGLKKGAIVDIDKTVQSIRRAVEQAERMVGLSIRRVIVGVAGSHIQLHDCHGIVAVASENREISDEDVARVIDAAQVVSIPPDREIISVVPRQFIVDGLDGIHDPRGMIGVRLEMEGTMVTGAKTILHNLLRCVERAGLEISDICLQPLAAGSLALSDDERHLGAAFVDLGGGSTTVAVFEQGALQAVSSLPVGGEHITKDLAIGLRTTTEDAEKIKLKHGYAFYDYASDEEVFSVPVMGSDQHQQFSQLEIADIIEARMEEILQMVQHEVRRLGFRDLPGGYVLTGGVANMPGVLELAHVVLGTSVRVAMPDYIGVRDPQYTIGVGLLKFAYRQAQLQGKTVPAAAAAEPVERPAPKQPSKPKKKEDHFGKKVKKFFGSFFE